MKSEMIMVCCVGLFLLLTIVPVVTHAIVPQQINYQGYLTTSGGNPVPDGDYVMSFGIYDVSSGGTPLWSEAQTVTVTKGIYNVILGQNPFPSDLFDGDLYLGVRVETDAEMTPRQKIVSVAFTMKAAKAEDSDTLDGKDSTELDQSTHAGDTNNPHSVSAAQTGAAGLSDITWENLSNIPGGFADNVDDEGITTEVDPTVSSSVKDGVSWNELSGMPSGFTDGVDNTGITSESDPQVGSNSYYYVPKWDGSALVKGSIYDNGNVGIGTINPTEKLEVGGNLLFPSDGSNHQILMPDAARTLYIGGSTNYTNPYTIAMWGSSSLRFGTNKIERLRITSSGQVGIGTSNPAEKLDVEGNLNVKGNINVSGEITWPTRTGYHTVPPAAFIINNTNQFQQNYWLYGDSLLSNDAPFYAPVYLPHGATVSRFVAYFADSTLNWAWIDLVRCKFFNGELLLMAELQSSGSNGERTYYDTVDINEPEVDNFLYYYYLKLWLPLDVTFYGAKVEYTYTSPAK